LLLPLYDVPLLVLLALLLYPQIEKNETRVRVAEKEKKENRL
jgi:hypothetical protein